MVVAPWFRLGYVIPHLYTDLDAYQFYKVAPDGVMLVTTQLDLAGYSLEAVERELPTFWSRIELLASKRADVIALSGVPIASVLGRPRVLAMLDEVSQRTGLPASTDLEAHIAALRAFDAERIALGSRWPAHVIEALTAYLAAAGIRVVAVRAESGNLEQNKSQDPAESHELALRLGREALRAAPDARALMLPGGLWFAIHAAPILEAEFGVPVSLNITATLRAALLHHSAPLPAQPDPRWGRVLASVERAPTA
jgi:maleate cis-trans isomerase